MAYETILLTQEEGIATITLNRPDKLNALTPTMMAEIHQALGEVARDKGVRVVILTGAGRAFCAGADLNSPIFSMTNPADLTTVFDLLGRDVLDIRQLDRPIIAAVNGPAIGAAFNLALACDIIIASEAARFGEVFVNIGLQPDGGGTYFLPRLVGTARAMELMLTGRIFDAREAERLGIVNQVVPPEKLMDTARELARKIAQGSPLAIAFTKASVYQALSLDLAAALEAEGTRQSLLFLTEDMKEGIRAFLEKRPPQFKGR